MHYILLNKNRPVISINMDNKTGYISKITDIYQIEYLPMGVSTKKGLPNRQQLNHWWQGRNIPASRSGLQEALLKLNIENQNELIAKCFGLSLSDQYWIKPTNSSFTWEQINFFTNDFSNDVGEILFGKEIEGEINFASPDNTSDGWLKKKWKIINGERCLLKAGSPPFMQEPVNEELASCLFQRLENISFVPYHTIYEHGEPFSICKNFVTPDTELITAYHIYNLEKKPNHISVYEHLVSMFQKIGINTIEEFLNKMLACDYLLVNSDRHLNNFGIIRNINTLEIEGMAPLFDNGSSLWYNTLSTRITVLNNASKPFCKKHEEQIKLVSSLEWFHPEKLNGIEEEFSEHLKKSEYIDTQRRDILCKNIKTRIKLLKQEKEQSHEKQIRGFSTEDSSTLIQSTEQSIVVELKKVGFHPTEKLIVNLKQLNSGRGKNLSIKEVKEIWKKECYYLEEKELIEDIVGELQQQEKNHINQLER